MSVGRSLSGSAANFTSDDLTVGRLERQITDSTIRNASVSGVGGGLIGSAGDAVAKRACRTLYTHLCASLSIASVWRRGCIVGIVDGKEYKAPTRSVPDSFVGAVEVVFDNASVQLYHNRTLLRVVNEVSLCPTSGPPLWSQAPAPIIAGGQVAVCEVDPETLACTFSRALGVPGAIPLPWWTLRHRMESSLFPSIQGVGRGTDGISDLYTHTLIPSYTHTLMHSYTHTLIQEHGMTCRRS